MAATRATKTAAARATKKESPIEQSIPPVQRPGYVVKVANIEPRAAGFIQSMMNAGYTYTQAVEDTVDNCVDADASAVRITTESVADLPKKGESHADPFLILSLNIGDNGRGMTLATLQEAMRLGGKNGKANQESILGRFSMGMKTAFLATSRRLVVYTKARGHKLYRVTWDVDETIKNDSWDIGNFIEVTDKEEIAFFYSMLPEGAKTGTLVRWEKPDRLNGRRPATVLGNIRRSLGQVFRKFLTAERGRRLTIETGNKPFGGTVSYEPVEAIDPLELDKPGTMKGEDGEFEGTFEVVGLRGQKSDVSFRLSALESTPEMVQQDRRARTKSQGFSVLRNNREVCSKVSLDLYTPYNEFARFRGELLFSSDLDEEFGISFQKHHVDICQSVQDQLAHHMKTAVNLIRKRMRAQQVRAVAADDEINSGFEQAAKASSKQVLLIERCGDLTPTKFVFARGFLCDLGPLFKYDIEGDGTVTITMNVEHPAYIKLLEKPSESYNVAMTIISLVVALIKLEYSYGSTGSKQINTKHIAEFLLARFSDAMKIMLTS